MSDAPAVFDAQAGDYDAARRRLIPPFEAFYGTAVQVLDLAGAPLRRVLDLGAGTGLLAQRVLAAHHAVELTLLDGAPRMLEQARERLGAGPAYLTADLADPLPAGPWDAVVSALAIHHLDDPGKRALFARVYAGLRPGGVFVNAEQVLGSGPRLTTLAERWHEAEARRAGTSDTEWAATLQRMQVDRCATVEAQLGWLREAGFAEVDCPFRHHRFAVLVAVR